MKKTLALTTLLLSLSATNSFAKMSLPEGQQFVAGEDVFGVITNIAVNQDDVIVSFKANQYAKSFTETRIVIEGNERPIGLALLSAVGKKASLHADNDPHYVRTIVITSDENLSPGKSQQ